jgi:hypothetical protein
LQEHLLVLFLEVDDEDLESCFGDDCDEKGIRRTFNVRKLLVPESAVAAASAGRPANGRIASADLPSTRDSNRRHLRAPGFHYPAPAL